MVTLILFDSTPSHELDEPAHRFLLRTSTLALLAALFDRGVRARTLLTRIGIPRSVTMPTDCALEQWFVARRPSLRELVAVLVAMFERDAARELGLVELYDEIVIESESYDGDPAPLCCENDLSESTSAGCRGIRVDPVVR
jgi:hypothetical protein